MYMGADSKAMWMADICIWVQIRIGIWFVPIMAPDCRQDLYVETASVCRFFIGWECRIQL